MKKVIVSKFGNYYSIIFLHAINQYSIWVGYVCAPPFGRWTFGRRIFGQHLTKKKYNILSYRVSEKKYLRASEAGKALIEHQTAIFNKEMQETWTFFGRFSVIFNPTEHFYFSAMYYKTIKSALLRYFDTCFIHNIGRVPVTDDMIGTMTSMHYIDMESFHRLSESASLSCIKHVSR